MTDLLTPEEIQAWEPENEGLDPYYNRLYRAYLTLWDRNKELEATLIAAAKLGNEIREEFRGLRKDLEGRISS